MNRRIPIIAFAATLFLVAAVAVAIFGGGDEALEAKPIPKQLRTTLLPQPLPLKPFTLSDHNGNSFTLESLKKRWSILFFGYTHCPDICPTTLGVLKAAVPLMQKEGLYDGTQMVFVSVDPKRDSPQHLKEYLAYFNPDFVGATGEKAQIDTLVREAGAIYMFDGDIAGDDYIVNHSATLYLVNPQGELVARFSTPHTPSGVTDTYRRIRSFYQE